MSELYKACLYIKHLINTIISVLYSINIYKSIAGANDKLLIYIKCHRFCYHQKSHLEMQKTFTNNKIYHMHTKIYSFSEQYNLQILSIIAQL